MKQVDLLAICPETGEKIAIECVGSTLFDPCHEPDQAMRDLAEGPDAVVVVAPTREALKKLEAMFVARLGPDIDARITLAMPCHLAEAPSFRHVYECPSLVYDSRWDKSTKPRKEGR